MTTSGKMMLLALKILKRKFYLKHFTKYGMVPDLDMEPEPEADPKLF